MPHPYGNNIKLDIRGGSHDPEISMTLSGLPAGIAVDTDVLQTFMARRAPGQNAWSTPRKEADQPHFKSGMIKGEDGLLYTRGTVGRFVTSDQAVLQRARELSKREILHDLLEQTKALGITGEELIRYIREEEKL